MVAGVGNDLVDVSRIEQSIDRHGERFVKRILSEREYQGFVSASRQANYLAKRFAVKEAVSKALGTGVAKGVLWHNIEVEYSELGAPIVRLSGGAKDRLASIGGENVKISIADEGLLVSVFAVAY